MKKQMSLCLSLLLIFTLLASVLIPDSFVFAAGDEKYSGVFNYGGFEENKVWTKKNILRIVKVSIVEPGAAESNYALQVERKASSVSPATFITTSKDGAFDEWNTDVKYCLSFALKTLGDFEGTVKFEIKQNGKTIRFSGANDVYIIGSYNKEQKIDVSDWKTFSTPGFSITKDVLEISLCVNGKGTILFDNFDLTEDPEEKNMLVNGGFENGGWYNETANGSSQQIVSDITDNSQKAAHLTGTAENGKVCIATDAKKTFDRKKTYTLSLSLKTKDVEENKVFVRILQRFTVEGQQSASWLRVYGLEEIIRTGGTTDWSTYTVNCRKFADYDDLSIVVYIFLEGKGEAWVDNVFMSEKQSNVEVGAGVVSSDTPEGDVDPLTIVHLMTASEDSDIYYTVDGSDPHTSDTKLLYNDEDGVIITDDTTVKAYVATEDERKGEIAAFEYTCEHLLPAKGFENALWTPSIKAAVSADTAIKKNGAKSMRIDGNGALPTATTGFIPLDTSFDYKLSFWAKTQDMLSDGNAFVSVFMTSDFGNDHLDGKRGMYIRGKYDLVNIGGNQDWTHYEVMLDELHQGFSDINITVGVKNDMGTVWFDDFDLVAVQANNRPLTLSAARSSDQLLGSIYKQNIMGDFEIEKTVSIKSNVNLEEIGTIYYEVTRNDGVVISDGSFEAGVGPGGKQDYTINLSTIAEYGTFAVSFKMKNETGYTYPIDTLKVSRIRDASDRSGKTKLAFSAHAMTGGYLANKYDKDSIDAYFDMMVAAGTSVIREDVLWQNVEQSPGVYTFPEWWDTYLDSAKAHGVEIQLVINSQGNIYGSTSFPKTDEELAQFAAYAKAVIEKYKGKIKYYELFNETNYSKVTDGAGYTAMLKYVYPILKAADPDCKIITGVLSGTDTKYAEEILKAGGADYMDMFSFHPYVYPSSPEKGNFKAQLEEMKALFNKYTKKDIHFWLTELGWSSCENDLGVTEEQKADYLLRTLQIVNELDYVDYMMQYETHMSGNKYFLENNWGALGAPTDRINQYAANQVFIGYGAFNNLLAGYKYAGSEQLSQSVFVRKYTNAAAKKNMWILWTDDTEANVTVTLDRASARLFDFYGNAIGIAYNSDGVSFNETFDGSIKYLQTDSSDFIKSIVAVKNGTSDDTKEEKPDNTVINNNDDNNGSEDISDNTEDVKKTTKKIKRIKRVSGKKGTDADDSGLPVWAIILIACGGVLVVASGVFFTVFFIRRRKGKKIDLN